MANQVRHAHQPSLQHEWRALDFGLTDTGGAISHADTLPANHRAATISAQSRLKRPGRADRRRLAQGEMHKLGPELKRDEARPVAMPREISSRSSSRSATGALRRGAGAIPPLTAKTR
jgi:hypothetical protein